MNVILYQPDNEEMTNALKSQDGSSMQAPDATDTSNADEPVLPTEVDLNDLEPSTSTAGMVFQLNYLTPR